MKWLERRHVVGKVRGWVLDIPFLFIIHLPARFLPYVGYVTIAMVRFAFILFETILTFLQNDFPQLKYALLGIMGLFALVQRE
jgi:signal peptidase I